MPVTNRTKYLISRIDNSGIQYLVHYSFNGIVLYTEWTTKRDNARKFSTQVLPEQYIDTIHTHNGIATVERY